MAGGTASYQGGYSQMVSDVGNHPERRPIGTVLALPEGGA